MSIIRQVLFILSVMYLEKSISSREVVQRLQSPRVTNWGQWGKLDFCPPNSWVSGMNLKTQAQQGWTRDDTGLNGIQLQCYTKDWNHYGTISSLTGSSGNYGNVKHCPKGFATGYQLRSEHNQGGVRDDAGAVDFKLRCVNFDGTTSYVINDQKSPPWGTWTPEQNCPPRTAVCAMATQIELNGGKDSTSLNNVDLACCKIPDPAETCKLEMKWQTLTECTKAGKGCETNFTTGFVENKYHKLSNYYKKLGFIVDFEFVQKALKKKAKLNGSKIMNEKHVENIISETEINVLHWRNLFNCEGIIQQFFLTCGPFKVFTKEYRCVPKEGQGNKYKGGLYFQPNAIPGKILWSYNCDFKGGDIASKISRIEDCGDVCYKNSECTHFTWTTHKGGTCWMKGPGVSVNPVEKYDENLVCGWMERPRK